MFIYRGTPQSSPCFIVNSFDLSRISWPSLRISSERNLAAHDFGEGISQIAFSKSDLVNIFCFQRFDWHLLILTLLVERILTS